MLKTLATAILIALCCSGCASSIRYYPFQYKQEMAQGITRVAIAPLNLINPMPEETGGKAGVVHAALLAYLAAHGINTTPSFRVSAIFKEEQARLGGVTDQPDGKLDKEKLNTAITRMMRRVFIETGADAIILPEVIQRRASIESSQAFWDGTWEFVGMNVTSPGNTISGEGVALSLRILMFNRDGKIVLRNIAGLEYPYTLMRKGGGRGRRDAGKNQPHRELRKDLFEDAERVRRAVALGVHPFVPDAEFPPHPLFLKE